MNLTLYDQIGGGYDSTRRADPYIVSRLAHHLQPQPGQRYLDIACGTGNYTIALSCIAGQWVGVDRSLKMLSRANQKSREILWHCGDILKLPYRSGGFSGAICVLALHHFPVLVPTIKETLRVLSGGRLVIFTSTSDQMKHYWLAEYFPNAMRRSIEQMPARQVLEEALVSAGFVIEQIENYEVSDDLQDQFLYCGKHRPALYLDENVRRGISTFAATADPEEVKAGLANLQADLESHRIKDIQKKGSSREGDYCFIVACGQP